jgi:SAM-dependent methyltransferase
VLAIMPTDVLENTLAEIFRVLRPGGVFVFNESVWRDETPLETISEINRECQKHFGIPQASEQFPYAQDWINLCVSKGFETPEIIHLEKMPEILPALPPLRRPCVLFKSKLFTLIGSLKSRLFPQLRRQRREWLKNETYFRRYGLFLEGVLFKMWKPN